MYIIYAVKFTVRSVQVKKRFASSSVFYTDYTKRQLFIMRINTTKCFEKNRRRTKTSWRIVGKSRGLFHDFFTLVFVNAAQKRGFVEKFRTGRSPPLLLLSRRFRRTECTTPRVKTKKKVRMASTSIGTDRTRRFIRRQYGYHFRGFGK